MIQGLFEYLTFQHREFWTQEEARGTAKMSQGNFKRTIAPAFGQGHARCDGIICIPSNPISIGCAKAYMTIRLMLHMRSVQPQQPLLLLQRLTMPSHREDQGPKRPCARA
jgi:hypothetical protein